MELPLQFLGFFQEMPKLIYAHIEKRFEHLFLICLLVPLFVSIFSGYQEDTDGYVLQTSRFTGLAILGILDYPFSQYGPAWSLSLGIISILTPDVLLSATLRILTLLAYALCIIRLSLHLREIGRQYLVFIGFSTIVLTHYISFPNYAWASTFGIFFATLLFHLISKVHFASLKFHHIAGFSIIVVFCVFSRVQIGASLFLIVAIYLFSSRGLKSSLYFLALTLFFVVMVLVTLYHYDFAQSAIYDQFILAPIYNLSVQSPLLSLPIPTFALATFLMLMIFLLERRPHLLLRILIPFAFCILTITLILDFLEFPMAHVFRFSVLQKCFTSLVISLIFYIIIKLIASLKRSSESILATPTTFLCVIALANCSQIYPRFGSHHAWFSFFLLFFAFLSVFPFPHQETERKARISFPFSLKLLIVILAFIQVATIRDLTYVRDSASFILMKPKSVSEYATLQRQLDLSIPKGETVINLCPITSVFYLRKDLESASRLFVVWDRFLEISDYSRGVFEKSPHFLVSCDDKLLRDFEIKLSDSQTFDLKPISRVEVMSRKWQISKIQLLTIK